MRWMRVQVATSAMSAIRVHFSSGNVINEATFRRVAELKNKRIQGDYKPTSVTHAEIVPLFAAMVPAIDAIVDFAKAREERQ